MTTTRTFLEQYLTGDVDMDAIDDFVETWHTGDGGTELWEFLGMTWEEYALWVERPVSLPFILAAHRKHTS